MSAPLWTVADIVAATGAAVDEPSQTTGNLAGLPQTGVTGQASREAAITGISIDTRTIQPGDLFVALKDVRDGHEFVGAAFAARSLSS